MDKSKVISSKTQLLRLFLVCITLFTMTGCFERYKLYGLVVDQDGNPVANFPVLCYQNNMDLVGNAIVSVSDCSTTTDQQGRFYINETLNRPNIGGVTRHGYEMKRTPFEGLGETYTIAGQRIITSEKGPFVFHVWKGEAEPLIELDEYYKFKRDGSIYSLNLVSGEKSLNPSLDDLQIQFIAAPGNEPKQKGWKLILRTKNGGGLISSYDEFMYLAPETGYHQEVILEQSDDDNANPRSINMKKRFYLKSRSGEMYARLELDIRPFYNEYSSIHIHYWANPNSSRNLMYDAKTKIYIYKDTPYHFAKMAFDAGKYDKAMERLLIASNHGDGYESANASALIGKMYYQGLGREKNYKKAFEWYSLAANQAYPEGLPIGGDPRHNSPTNEALYMLGIMYKDGRGVTKDLDKAFEWFGASYYKGWLTAGEMYADKGDLPMAYCYFNRLVDNHIEGINADAGARAKRKFKKVSHRMTQKERKIAYSYTRFCKKQ